MKIPPERIEEIKAACEAIREQTWEKPEKRYEVIIPDGGPGLVVADVTFHEAGIHIANMDPATTLKLLKERKEREAEIERLHKQRMDYLGSDFVQDFVDRAEKAEARLKAIHDAGKGYLR